MLNSQSVKFMGGIPSGVSVSSVCDLRIKKCFKLTHPAIPLGACTIIQLMFTDEHDYEATIHYSQFYCLRFVSLCDCG